MMNQSRLWFLVGLVGVCAGLRIVDHSWNLAPIGALALFAGAHVRDFKWAVAVPLAAMFVGDVGLGIVREDWQYAFHGLMPISYGCYAVSVLLGVAVRRSWRQMDQRTDGGDSRHTILKTLPVATATLAGSVFFFAVTNFGVWAIFPTYAKSWTGLVDCYLAALPFFRNTLSSDVFFAAALFGGYAVLKELFGWADESSVLHAN